MFLPSIYYKDFVQNAVVLTEMTFLNISVSQEWEKRQNYVSESIQQTHLGFFLAGRPPFSLKNLKLMEESESKIEK